ncbi:MAG: phosphoenolpyruvate--protein phosphotransferase [Synergistaceae bacterium]|nr:phosphoenolpyruvate--protein phosphotransferase [Synergistaceae bacterium]
MIEITGVSVFSGVAIGPLRFYKQNRRSPERVEVTDREAEMARFERARKEAGDDLERLYEKAVKEVGESNAAIFDIHRMMLDDPDYIESVTGIITAQGVSAEYAVSRAAENFAKMFSAMDDAYMSGRAADVMDIADRVLAKLSPDGESQLKFSSTVILAAQDLAPSETVQLEKDKVLGFVTARGSVNSHTAILARTMAIPAVINMGDGLLPEYDGKLAELDGFTGTLYVEPDAETLAAMEKKRGEYLEKRALLEELKGQPNVTLDGRLIKVFANVSNISDLGSVIKNDAEGIGLFRSEFIYIENSSFPSEEEQFEIYKQAVETMGAKQVVIRTLDIGADKQAPYFDLPHEQNPAMGMRAIRICLTRHEIFKTQLRALFRASVYGNLAIMFPMITSPREVDEALAIAAEVKGELSRENIPFKEDMSIGIMIETPAAVMMSAELARKADFFSVGTNDLTQYTLAVDRQNQQISRFYDPRSEAVLRMIKMAADNAHAAGKWIGICGEMGADTELTERFLRMGIDEISVSSGAVLYLRQKIRSLDLSR